MHSINSIDIDAMTYSHCKWFLTVCHVLTEDVLVASHCMSCSDGGCAGGISLYIMFWQRMYWWHLTVCHVLTEDVLVASHCMLCSDRGCADGPWSHAPSRHPPALAQSTPQLPGQLPPLLRIQETNSNSSIGNTQAPSRVFKLVNSNLFSPPKKLSEVSCLRRLILTNSWLIFTRLQQYQKLYCLIIYQKSCCV